jgi:hypothetical protein
MGNEVAIGCRSCLVLTMARFPTGGVRKTPEWVLCCASAWVAGSVKAIKATPTRQACSQIGRASYDGFEPR